MRTLTGSTEYHYTCGCVTPEADRHLQRGPRCPVHGKKMTHITKPCAGCGEIMELRPPKTGRQRCEPCAKDRHSRQYIRYDRKSDRVKEQEATALKKKPRKCCRPGCNNDVRLTNPRTTITCDACFLDGDENLTYGVSGSIPIERDQYKMLVGG